MQHNKEKQFWLLCFLFVIVAYLPVTSFQFAVKNDFFTAYFPLKKFLSTSIQAGHFPLWNPFLNYGFPIYGDMSEAWWNPVTWFIAAVPGYNVWTFTLELVAYLFLAFGGMYTLTGRWIVQMEWRIMAAASYAASGFMVGHLQHINWISAAALLPFCLHYLFSFIHDGRKYNFFLAALCIVFFVTAAHPGLIIGALVYGIAWLFKYTARPKVELRRLGILLATTMLTCAGMIYGYTEVLPYTNRSAALEVVSTPEGSTTLNSWLSLFLPLATTRGSFFTNDIALRNCYFGLLGFALCIYISTSGKRSRNAGFHLLLGIIFLILSSDFFLPVFQRIPLLKFIRLNGELRIFSILSFVLAAFVQLSEIWKMQEEKKLAKVLWVLETLLFVSCFATGIFALPILSAKLKLLPDVKSFLDSMSFSDMVFVQSLLLIGLNIAMIKSLGMRNKKALMWLVLADMAIACLIQLPFTGVGQRSVAEIDRIFAEAPIQKTPSSAPEKTVVSQYPDVTAVAGNWALVSQEIAQDGLIPYPLIFEETELYMMSEWRDSFYRKSPFFTVNDRISFPAKPLAFHYNLLRFNINSSEPSALVVKQNHYPFWRASLNGKAVPITDTAFTFMKLPLVAGKNELELQFKHPLIRMLLVFQFVMMAFMAIMAYRYRKDTIA